MANKITEQEVEYIVGQVVATSSFEGMVTPKEEICNLKKMVRGEISYDEYKRNLIRESESYGR